MTDNSELETAIEKAWEERDSLSSDYRGPHRDAVKDTLAKLDSGKLRVAEKIDDEWMVRQWSKKAVLLSFRLFPNRLMQSGVVGSGLGPWWDKVGNKFEGWGTDNFEKAGFRAVPGAVVRQGAFVAKNAVLMPSFVNIGAFVDEDTMVDTWVTIGSCAQVGKRCHISGGVGLGGVLEPLQANPTIIEDNCFIGARSEVVEGVIVGEGSVISMGVFLGAGTYILDRETGEVHKGRIPPYSVVVPGMRPDEKNPGYGLSCAMIVKTVDAKTREKTSINELLRH